METIVYSFIKEQKLRKKKLKGFRTGWIGILFLLVTSLCGQEPSYETLLQNLEGVEGKERIELLYQLCRKEIFNDQALAMTRGREASTLAKKLRDVQSLSKANKCIGLAFHYTDRMDSARYYYEESATQSGDPLDQAWCYYNIAIIFQNYAEYDSAYFYLNKCNPIYLEYGTAGDMADQNKAMGDLAALQADWDDAAQFYFKADSLYGVSDDKNGKADALKGISYVYASQEDYPATIKVLKDAYQLYVETEDGFYGSETLNHIGYYFQQLGELDSALEYYEQGLEQARQVNNSHTVGACLEDIGSILVEQEDFEQAKKYFTEAEEFYRTKGDPYKIVGLLLARGDLERKAGQHRQAIDLYTEGIKKAQEIDAFDFLESLYGGKSLSEEAINDFGASLKSYKKYNEVKDSTKSVAVKGKVNDLLIKYQTLEKEKKLIQAQADIEQQKLRNRILWISLLGIVCLVGLLFYVLNERRKKEKLRLEKENEIEALKREQAEQELEFKQKELTAKVLQLASKNEFLQSLEQEFDLLKSSVDQKVSDTTRKISRMIRRDGIDDEEWDKFSQEFSGIHQSFIEKIQEKHGQFSKSEWRLISLMKMNLSAKEIANILRISSDGVKKARYRLRKKLDLDSQVDLQSYLLGL
jgi:tetratricopeptide (TPR) repeat protein/DNA-binding CsgD family transcriptional regulator